MTNHTYASKLRAFARYLDTHPEIAEKVNDWGTTPSFTIYCDDSANFGSLCRALGEFDKEPYAGMLTAIHKETWEDSTTKFRLAVSISGVCEKVAKLDEFGNPVTRKKSAYVETEELETEYEYRCPESWLSL